MFSFLAGCVILAIMVWIGSMILPIVIVGIVYLCVLVWQVITLPFRLIAYVFNAVTGRW